THAHSRILFNYGIFLRKIYDHLDPKNPLDLEKRQNILELIIKFKSCNNLTKAVEIIAEINKAFELETSSVLFIKDDLENHALLNQITTYSQNLTILLRTVLNDELLEKAEQSFDVEKKKVNLKTFSRYQGLTSIKNPEKQMDEKEEKDGKEEK